jgi:glutamine amidotransferase
VLPAAAGAESTVDSAILAAHLFDRGVESTADVVVSVAGRDPSARLNLLLTDGERAIATTWGDTLSYLADETGTTIASEPHDDDPRWVDVPDHHLLEVTPDGITLTALE